MNYSTSFTQMLISLRESGCLLSRTLIVYKNQCTSNEVDYLTMRGGMISFLPSGKEHKITEDGKWSREGRQDGKPARVIRKVLTETLIEDCCLDDKTFEKFSNSVASYVGIHGDGDGGSDPKYTMVVANGDLIPLYYYAGSYSNCADGNLIGSCMKNGPESYFEMYAKNPNVISMAVCLDAEHKVAGRALIWKTTNKGLCMDTIYASESIRPMFIDFAIQNGMRYKGHQSCHHSIFDMFNGKTDDNINTEVSVKLYDYDFSEYPYMDTMMYLCMQTRIISNTDNGMEEYRTLRSTGGDYESNESTVSCVWSGDRVDENDCVYLDYRRPNGSHIYGYVHMDHCSESNEGWRLDTDIVEVSGRYYMTNSDDITYVEYEDEYYLNDDVVWDINGDAILYEDATELSNGDYAMSEDCIMLHDGTTVLLEDTVLLDNNTYALRFDSVKCSETGRWFLIGDSSAAVENNVENN